METFSNKDINAVKSQLHQETRNSKAKFLTLELVYYGTGR